MCVCRVEVSSSASLKLTFQVQSFLLNPGLTAGLDTALLRSVYASPATSIELHVHATMPIFYLGSENPILAVHPMPQALSPLSHPDLCVAVEDLERLVLPLHLSTGITGLQGYILFHKAVESNQISMLTRQAVYCLSHIPVPPEGLLGM